MKKALGACVFLATLSLPAIAGMLLQRMELLSADAACVGVLCSIVMLFCAMLAAAVVLMDG